MISIRSKINSRLLHVIIKFSELESFRGGRSDISEPSEALQVSFLRASMGTTFKPHAHLAQPKHNLSVTTQESWVVITGQVEVSFFDIDDTLIERRTLTSGDCSITFEGGHGYRILEENTFVYEFKTGPYLGKVYDKREIRGEAFG